MQKPTDRAWPVWALAACAACWLGGAPVAAQEAHLTLLPDVTPWNEQVEVRVEGVGCGGPFLSPVVTAKPSGFVIDIDLLGCEAGSTAPFAISAKIGPFLAGFGPYRIRVRNGTTPPLPSLPPPPVLDEVELPIYGAASVLFELPEMATDAAPVSLVTWLAGSCYCLSGDLPQVRGQVIEFSYSVGSMTPGYPPSPGTFPFRWDLGMLAPGVYEVRAFDLTHDVGSYGAALARTTLVVHAAEGCVPSSSTLCLGGGRFKVEAVWTDFAGGSGSAHARPLDGDGASGLLWFFAPDNVELTAKLLDGCSVNDHFWFFLASGSTVEYTVTVTDTVTGAKKTYANPSGHSAPLLSDTSAFSCSGS